MDAGPWNSLELAKLIAGLLTPTVLAILGVFLGRLNKRYEHVQWRSQKLIEKRLVIYDDIAPILNDILCYFTYVGCWRDLDPPTIVSLKRSIDKKIYIAAPLFSNEFFHACMEFQNLCFETYNSWGQDAKLRTNYLRHQQAKNGGWASEWADCFSDKASDPEEIHGAYNKIMSVFANDIGVHTQYVIPSSGRVPRSIL